MMSVGACAFISGKAEAHRVTARRLLVIGVMVFGFSLVATPASAYWYESTSTPVTDCTFCHGVDQATAETSRTGPHGGYSTTTNKCSVCHMVHNAPAGVLLLPAATVKGTCEMCHDGTGGAGVYGVVAARLGPGAVKSAHSIDVTSAVPGGDAATGATSTAFFGGLTGALTCSDCHSPHAANVVAPFTGDRARSTTDTVITTSRLLRRMPTTATQTVDFYGSDWCGACHKGRLAGSGTYGNHPVDSLASSATSDPFVYERVARERGVNTSSTEFGTLGRNNFGFVMPDNYSADHTRTPEQRGHYPICQQCHEDGRRVGNVLPRLIDTSEIFSVTATRSVGATVGDNPEFQTFPHESDNEYLLVEPAGVDSLCLNCHAMAGS